MNSPEKMNIKDKCEKHPRRKLFLVKLRKKRFV